MGALGAAAFTGGVGVANAISNFATGSQVKSTYPTTNPAAGAMALQEGATAQQVEAYNQQGDEAQKEAAYDAVQKAQEVALFRDTQAESYNASGVMLEGSPMLVLNRTVQLGKQEIDRITQRGNALADLYRRNAMVVANMGRAALIGDEANFITQGAASQISALSTKAGMMANGANGLTGVLGNLLGNMNFGGGSGSGMSIPPPGDPLLTPHGNL